LEAVFSLSPEQLLDMSLMDLSRRGGEILLKQAIAAEISAYLGRDYYRHSDAASKPGHRNGARGTEVEMGNGVMRYERPLLTGAEAFHSKFHVSRCRKPEEFRQAVADMFVEGVSTRKVKRALKSLVGEKTKLGRSTVSRITKALRKEFAAWRSRSLGELEPVYLFLDAIYLGMRMDSSRKQAVLLAYACLTDGSFQVLSIGLGNAESKTVWMNFVSDLKSRGLADPLLAVSDGNEGVIQAIEANLDTSYRQRCVKHKMDNILAAVPKEKHEEVREELNPIFYGSTSLEQAKAHLETFRKQYSKIYPTAVDCLMRDIDQVFTFYLFPASHWKRIRTSNCLERMNQEIKRRLRVIGRHPSEEGCLALVYKVTQNYSDRRKFKVDDISRSLWKRLREEKEAMLQQLKMKREAA
jgi:transposase-like protein